ncbi:MAG: hypothetical protein R6V23_07820, partial [Bacteroidales bacterium]
HLYEMLEGQVAILSAGHLSAKESLDVLDSLKKSKMFRPDQYSYMLYPDRALPRFPEKNNIPAKKVEESALLSELVEKKNFSIIKVDKKGNYHFNSDFRNAEILEQALDNIKDGGYDSFTGQEKEKILEIYEEMFDHQSFTGRSGTFFGYEGLGSIYWHMVSKLLLATQECYFRAVDEGAGQSIVSQIKDHYYEIKAGIGLYKSPELYGAFPTDAYSHTPSNEGVKQPGLTGQVKEDFISRLGEMGIRILNGEIYFDTSLLNHEEILTGQKEFEYYSIKGEKQKIIVDNNQLALTFCQVPIIYTASKEDTIIVTFKNNQQIKLSGKTLKKDISKQVFMRTGDVEKIDVWVQDLKK